MLSLAENLSRELVHKLSTDRHEPDWLAERRRAGFEIFETQPTPDWTRGIRGWWNDPLKTMSFERLQPFAAAGQNLPDLGIQLQGDDAPAGILVQYNSQVVRVELSEAARQKGVVFSSLEDAVKTHPELVQKYFMTQCVPVDENRFTGLHAAFWTGGAFLYLPDDVIFDAPFQTIFYNDAPEAALFTHTLVITGDGSKARLVEEHRSAGNADTAVTFDAGVTEIFVGKHSIVEYYNPQLYAQNVTSYSTKRAIVGDSGRMNWMVANLGSGVSRLTLESFMDGQFGHAEATGLSFPTDKQNFDLFARTLHRVPNTTANSLFKQVLDDEALMGFRGAIRTLKGAQNTESMLEDHTLYLSEESKADVLPSLDVDANEVRCSHGASIGMIDADQIFYLMSRGLPREEAVEMIVKGFFAEALERIPIESVRERVLDAVDAKL
jgi:FeS assembly protein SufD